MYYQASRDPHFEQSIRYLFLGGEETEKEEPFLGTEHMYHNLRLVARCLSLTGHRDTVLQYCLINVLKRTLISTAGNKIKLR